jgi:hypothetical protein
LPVGGHRDSTSEKARADSNTLADVVRTIQ